MVSALVNAVNLQLRMDADVESCAVNKLFVRGMLSHRSSVLPVSM